MKKIIALSIFLSSSVFTGIAAADKDSFGFNKDKEYKGYLLKGDYFHPDVYGAVKLFDLGKGNGVDYELLVNSLEDKAKVRTKTYNGENVLVISHY